ncbi:hypothetical protein [Reyranella sp.]|jgi:hypothetical protein|uniref:hypothetical protein n=1 Tax=Reyranella sp. TaxID=1929291 RepID=UPI000BD35972|nr:hypothetical protein [Reyranella sp.]OYY43158.1 MAG: hypothetical protein B7Y57_10380 [Rhodospirillales bacterium 35-66-84]OYZ95127.1 MAG: hypothetical protein B7Y08_10190 [Rhodospirillales bacterium 24-66-33]OZB26567.1 MAG: hypothetical protein B7X63_08545 [Rhodospirillales bacterium 39-66-50]HQS15989.1 hypothetical protein [Reyranella sp.]HQT13255.1 hypothetical protein [Reyranella sp.]
MSEAPPDPGAPGPDKDALIADLRRQLGAAQSEIRVLRRRLGAATPVETSPAQGGLLNELREAAPRKVEAPANVAVKLGRRFDLWRSPVLVGLVMLLLTGFAVDAGVGLYQARALREARQARLMLENTAMRSLYVELKGISYEPDGKSYRMTLFLQNVSPAGPLYVMLNAVAVYVQAGMVWQQVPSRPAEGVSWGVVKLVDGYTFDVLFTPDVANWAELIPGYMHVRIQSDLLVSEKAQPGNDVVERRTPYYVYLKPHGANDEDIKARSKSTRTPPIFIPMPPH